MGGDKYQRFDQNKSKNKSKDKVKTGNASKFHKFMKSIMFIYLLHNRYGNQHIIYCKSCKKLMCDASLFDYLEKECIECRIKR